MNWGFLVGFTLGSVVLFLYHMYFLYSMCNSNKEKYAYARSDMLHFMIENGELEEVKVKDDDGH